MFLSEFARKNILIEFQRILSRAANKAIYDANFNGAQYLLPFPPYDYNSQYRSVKNVNDSNCNIEKNRKSFLVVYINAKEKKGAEEKNV